MLFYVGLAIVISASLFCWFEIKKTYEKRETLPITISVFMWIADTTHFLLVLSAALNNTWPLALNSMVIVTGGVLLIGFGLLFLLAGVISFRSFKKMSGLDTSTLITTGIYKWSRNPQYIGWFSTLFGISLLGQSALALFLTIALIVGIHLYTIRLEEPYLEQTFGREYRRYKLHIPRYFGIPKK